MKYINGLDSDNATATCPPGEKVVWAVPPKCDKVLVITVKQGIIRCYDEGGGVFSLPLPYSESRPRRNCDMFASYKEALDAHHQECCDYVVSFGEKHWYCKAGMPSFGEWLLRHVN